MMATNESYIVVDATILHIAMAEMERVDAAAVEDFLARTPHSQLVEMSMEQTGVVAYPSRLLMDFLIDCELLGLVN